MSNNRHVINRSLNNYIKQLFKTAIVRLKEFDQNSVTIRSNIEGTKAFVQIKISNDVIDSDSNPYIIEIHENTYMLNGNSCYNSKFSHKVRSKINKIGRAHV